MTEVLVLLWPIAGWAAGIVGARNIWKDDPILGTIVIFVCGAIAGPVLWIAVACENE